MVASNHLYRLSIFNVLPKDGPAEAVTEQTFRGQLVFAGPDAAIEITDGFMSGFINGERAHPAGQVAALIDNYDLSIASGARSLSKADTKTVVLAGKWHHVKFDVEPRFEAYLVHLIDASGGVQTRRYRSEIFDWDYPEMGDDGAFEVTFRGRHSENIATLDALAIKEIDMRRCPFEAASGLPAIDGILWSDTKVDDLPMLTSMVKYDENVQKAWPTTASPRRVATMGDGTIGSYFRAKSDFISQVDGYFRGATVDRVTHRPPELTLNEALSSTDAVGYWFQTWDGASSPFSMFTLCDDGLYRGQMLLRKLAPSTDEHCLGNSYASDWADLVGHYPPTRSRILAVGPTPETCSDPL
jgi:hypothetical protein